MRALAFAGAGDSAASSPLGEGLLDHRAHRSPLCLLTPCRWRLPVLQGVIVGHALEDEEAPPVTAPAHAYLRLGVELPLKSVVVPALGALVPCLGIRALATRPVCGCVDVSALAMTRLDRLLPVCGLVAPGHGLRTATRIVECAHALGVSARNGLAVARPGMIARSHTGPATGHGTVAGLVTALLLLTARGLGGGGGGGGSWQSGWSRQDREEAVGASRDRCNIGLLEEPAPAIEGGSSGLPMSSFPDLVRLLLGLSGSVDQRGAVLGSLLSAAGVTSTGGCACPGDICSSCCLLVSGACSRWVESRWCSLCDRFAQSM